MRLSGRSRPTRGSLLLRGEDEIEALPERTMDHRQHRLDDCGALERNRDPHAPSPSRAPRHKGRDDGAEVAVDRLGELDLARDDRSAPSLHPAGEQERRSGASTTASGNSVTTTTASSVSMGSSTP